MAIVHHPISSLISCHDSHTMKWTLDYRRDLNIMTWPQIMTGRHYDPQPPPSCPINGPCPLCQQFIRLVERWNAGMLQGVVSSLFGMNEFQFDFVGDVFRGVCCDSFEIAVSIWVSGRLGFGRA